MFSAYGKQRDCEFNKLNTAEVKEAADVELIRMRLIDGLACSAHQIKLLEHVQMSSTPPTLADCIYFAQQLEQIQEFSQMDAELTSLSIAYVDKNKESKRTNQVSNKCNAL